MKRYNRIIFTLILFVTTAFLAAYFEEDCRQMIRTLYVNLTGGDISFFHPGLYLHFPSGEFVLTIAIYFSLIFFILFPYSYHQRLWYFISSSTATILTITMISWVEARSRLISCTICNDGTMVLQYDDLKYNFIFEISCFVGSLFVIVPFIRNYKTITV